jgi:tetratricopeptide (TPR) repeat protein
VPQVGRVTVLAEHPAEATPSADVAMHARTMTDLVTGRSATGLVLQELCPIWQSLPWLRSQRYWARAGVEVFTSGEVPYIVTNDGEQSRKALEVYLGSLRHADERGRREPTSYVFELGAGSGLFAKLFLDQLRDRSRAEGTDHYRRTKYLVGDYSAGLLDDTRASGVFADHEDRVERVHLPAKGLRPALAQAAPQTVGTIRAVHANYLLDSLPFTILSIYEGDLFELRIRTRLCEDATHPAGAPPPADLAALCAWLDELENPNRFSAHQALVYETEYRRVDRNDLLYGHLLASPGGTEGPAHANQQLIHSFGALACLEEVVDLLRPDGYFVAMDYGYDEPTADPIEFQCFGSSVAAGVNFSQLVEGARRIPGVLVGVPEADPVSLHARLFARDETPDEIVATFRTLYDKQAWDATEAPYRQALDLQHAGQYEAARWKYEAAHRMQPYNWSVMEAIVAFLSYTLSEHKAGLEVAKRALQLNHLSPRLWNLLGDCYYGLDALEPAERAYHQAARVNPADARARANLAYVFLKRGSPAEAIRAVGEALALDRAGEYREELLAKQTEALQTMATSHVRNAYGNINRLSGHHALPGRSGT